MGPVNGTVSNMSVAIMGAPESSSKLKIDLTFMEECRLAEQEIFWRDHQPWLKERGYNLRPRFHPGWVASWKGTGKDWSDCEDAQGQHATHVMDATRASDGSFVIIKRIRLSRQPEEAGIGRMFSAEPLASDPRNHCLPIHEVLPVPGDEDLVLLAMPLLFDAYTPHFNTIGEFVEFCRQVFEGLQFMHLQHVAHRDCKFNNLMMDSAPLYDEPVHPYNPRMTRDYKRSAKAHTRTERPVRYFLIDFGLSHQYDPADGPALAEPGYGGDQSVPEFKSDNPCDPFAVDVYCLGNVIRSLTEGSDFAPARKGFEFIKPLVDDMVQDDPTKRPTMDEAVSRLETICLGLSSWKLRSRFAKQKENAISGAFRSAVHWARQLRLILMSTPSVPKPKPQALK